jgi:hypothetical protein
MTQEQGTSISRVFRRLLIELLDLSNTALVYILGQVISGNKYYWTRLSVSGVVTDPADAIYHGQLSCNKDLLVRTNTASGQYGLAIGFK